MRTLPKREIAPENGKSGVPRLVVPDEKHEAIDWSIKSDFKRPVIEYPNRINKCPMGPCKECICND